MIKVKDETRRIEFYKENEDDKIWWVDYIDQTGLHAVSFDKKKNLKWGKTASFRHILTLQLFILK